MVTSPSTIASSSDHGDPTFDEALQIDMKGLVGDAVGNVSTRSVLKLYVVHCPVDEYQSDQS